jgi:undecaprenyl-diphosphatase
LVFDVALHFGTFLAILIFFWKDIITIFRSAFIRNTLSSSSFPRKRESADNRIDSRLRGNDSNGQMYPQGMLWIILLATIPGAIFGALLEKQAETWFRDPWLIAINLAVFGVVIWWVDKYSRPVIPTEMEESYNFKDPSAPLRFARDDTTKNDRDDKGKSISLKNISLKQAFLIGLAQCLAIVPGVSRSGSTMAAGRALGLNRPDAAKFSFLLAAPIMVGSALFELRHFTSSMITTGFVLAFLAALVFGLLAIKYLLKYLERGSFAVFAWYRLVLALIIIVVFLSR